VFRWKHSASIILFAEYEATVTIERSFLHLYRKELCTFQTYSSLFSRSKEIKHMTTKIMAPTTGHKRGRWADGGFLAVKSREHFLSCFAVWYADNDKTQCVAWPFVVTSFRN
jgi:hypothetical protein